jgi:hypothetical protein
MCHSVNTGCSLGTLWFLVSSCFIHIILVIPPTQLPSINSVYSYPVSTLFLCHLQVVYALKYQPFETSCHPLLVPSNCVDRIIRIICLESHGLLSLWSVKRETAGFVWSVAAIVNTAIIRHQYESVTLWLAVYRQSIRLGAKPLEAHDRSFSFATEPLWA